jgi:hypothetical protein
MDVVLRCPDCGRKVVTINDAHDCATEVRRRHCRGCGEHWSIVFRPMGKITGGRMDELTWGRVAQVAGELSEDLPSERDLLNDAEYLAHLDNALAGGDPDDDLSEEC